jgi:hypothetical protein
MDHNLSKKKREELRRIKEDEDRERFKQFQEGLDEEYRDMYENNYNEFYCYFLDILRKKNYDIRVNSDACNDFYEFVERNSNHKDIFRDMKINKYLDDDSTEEEIDDESYEFLMKKTERF